jgi:outer membrane autotransporter protein
MLLVSGAGAIDMGSGPAAAALSGTQAAVPSLNALALVNDGVIDFLDGSTDDILTITGDLDGGGALNLDVSVLNGSSDTLYVDGSIVDGTTQAVNVTFQGVPSLDGAPVAFAFVSGDSSSTSFVPGQVFGYNPNNFINVKTTVSSNIDASNASADVFSVGIMMAGLNDAGVLAASVASGAHSLINSQIGTWRQRTGVLPRQDDGGLSPWIRAFSDDGEVDQQHVAADFTDTSDFRIKQSNQGRELGMNFALPGGFNYGVLLAKADGDQRLLGGAGSDRIDLSTVGVYGTWISPLGFYLDASYRWMDFDAELSSVGGAQSTSGNATAFNLEAGYTGWQVAGIDVVPQVQYTRTEITNIEALHGDTLEFAPEGGDSSRGRLGVGLGKTIARNGVTWTPYGSVNAVREFDGENRYTVAGDYHGLTRTDGTSAMVELGLGMQANGFSVTGGANWTDGGAQHGFLGGQLVLRYSW